MPWYQNDDEEEDLMFSPALMARRASESWIDTPPVEVLVFILKKFFLLLLEININNSSGANFFIFFRFVNKYFREHVLDLFFT